MTEYSAKVICDSFAWHHPPHEIDEGNFAHMSDKTLQVLLRENSTTLYPFNISGTAITGHKFFGLIVVVDETVSFGTIAIRR